MSQVRVARNRTILVLIFLLLASFLLMGVSQSRVTLRFKSVAFGMLYPFQFVGVRSITLVKDFFSSIENNRELKEELAQVKKLLEQYEKGQYEFEELRRENERLRRLIGVQSGLEYETVIAEVIAKSPQNFYKTLIVNRGRSSGIENFMPVVAYQKEGKCVVGKIMDVQQFSARIQPLIDQSSYVGAMLIDSRYSGILQGQNPISDLCLLQYIDRQAELNYGDEVVTSGMGGVFPKGIAIGEIVSVSKQQYGVFQEALVRPLVDFGRLEEVYIITKAATGSIIIPEEE
jgi:rod shape-determining protein MreC